MEYIPFDSELAFDSLKKGYQIRVIFSDKDDEYGFQIEKQGLDAIRVMYQKTNGSNPIKFSGESVAMLVQILAEMSVKNFVILPRDWYSLSEVSPKLPFLENNSETTPRVSKKFGIVVKNKLVYDAHSNTILGRTIDGKAHPLNPSVLGLLTKTHPKDEFYHVTVLGRDLSQPLGKKEFLKTISDLKRK